MMIIEISTCTIHELERSLCDILDSYECGEFEDLDYAKLKMKAELRAFIIASAENAECLARLNYDIKDRSKEDEEI